MAELDIRETLLARGVVIAPGLLDEREVASLRACFEALRAAAVPTTRQVLYTHAEPSESRPGFEELLEQWFDPHRRPGPGSTAPMLERLRVSLAAGLGPNLHLLQDVLLAKHAGQRAIPWHQDEPFWPIDTPWAAIAWCALDPVTAERGGVELALASQRELGPAIDLHDGSVQPGRIEPLRFDAHDYELVCPELKPGDALLFHARTWHRSGPNRSTQPRRAWVTTWLPGEARWNPARAPRHPRVREGAVFPGTRLEERS